MDNESLTYLFSIFGTRLRDSLDKRMKQIGLHGGQIFVLKLLWEDDGQSQAEIVKKLGLSAPTIYSMAVRLSDNEFIELRRDEYDARIMRIFLTEKGRSARVPAFGQWHDLEAQAFANLTEPEKMMLGMLLKKLVVKDPS
jgi:DNA-binding MarR family transcriptional regulator